jgi:hypothetical protein
MAIVSKNGAPRRPRRLLATLLAAAFACFASCLALPALAQSCNDDIGKFQERRQAQIAGLNALNKKGGGKLDPIAACPKLRTLSSVEEEMFKYMTKNKDWCNIPDDVLESVKEGKGKSANLAGQACKAAAQVSKMKQMQARQQQEGAGAGAAPVQRLPTGPL